jgi:CheY-like chemotaxis protein
MKVLLVEDEPLIALDVENMLLSLGCIVVGSSGHLAGAIELAETAEVDAALLDIFLPEGDVYPVVDILTSRGIPIAFLSCGDREDIPERYRHLALIGKPFATRHLEGGLHSALNGQAA